MDVAGRYVVNTSDLDEAATILGATYGRMRLDHLAETGEPRIRVWRTGVGPIVLDDIDITSEVTCRIDSADGIILCRVRAGSVELTLGDQSGTYVRGDMVLLLPGGAAMTCTLRESRCDVVSFDRGLLADAASHVTSTPDEPTPRLALPAGPYAGQQLADVLDHIRRFVANNPVVAQEPLLVDNAARYLTATMAFAFPSTVAR